MTAATVEVDWLTRAACRDQPATWWELSGQGHKMSADNKAAIAICNRCPMWARCAAGTILSDDGVIRAARPIRARVEAKAVRDMGRRHLGLPPITDDDQPTGNRDLLPCGTYAAYRRHVAHGEKPCMPCRRAANDYNQGRVRTAVAS